MNGRVAAVLFDMDGTLVDSEKVWDVGLADLARHRGGVLSPAARARMVGTNMWQSMDILHTDLGVVGADVVADVTWLEQRMGELFADGLKWQPGAQRLLEEVSAARIPAALVTATRRPLVDVALQTIGAGYFQAVVTGDDVTRSKPHPEPYRTAAALLGVAPGGCVAIEDSPTGVASAVAAGCRVVGVPSEVPLSDVDGCTVVDSLDRVDVAFLAGLPAR